MKKFIFLLILSFSIFPIFAYGKYGGITLSYYYGDGWAGAKYCGTTKDLTIEEVDNDRWYAVYYDNTLSDPERFNGKLSKRQSRLLWDALYQYNYETGEIYSVSFVELENPFKHYALSVMIEADGSCSWRGFTYTVR